MLKISRKEKVYKVGVWQDDFRFKRKPSAFTFQLPSYNSPLSFLINHSAASNKRMKNSNH